MIITEFLPDFLRTCLESLPRPAGIEIAIVIDVMVIVIDTTTEIVGTAIDTTIGTATAIDTMIGVVVVAATVVVAAAVVAMVVVVVVGFAAPFPS